MPGGDPARLDSRPDLPTTARGHAGLGAAVLASTVCSRQERSPFLSHQKAAPEPRGQRAGLRLPARGAGAVGCPWPGIPAGSAAWVSVTEAGHPVTVCRADASYPRAGLRPSAPGSQSRNGSGLRVSGISWATELSSTCSGHVSWAPGGPRPTPSPSTGTVGTEASGSSRTGHSYFSSPGSPRAARGLQACEVVGGRGGRMNSGAQQGRLRPSPALR